METQMVSFSNSPLKNLQGPLIKAMETMKKIEARVRQPANF
jgi:hypothetical protein